MFEWISGFLVGLFLNWYGFLGLCFVGIIFEHNDSRGLAVFTAIVSAIVGALFFHLTWQDLATGFVMYLLIGFVWSFWRYRRFVQTRIAELKHERTSYADSEIERLHPKNHTDTIVAWILIWPFSAVENVIGDVISGISMIVTTTLRKVYTGIYEGARANALKD